MDDLAMIKACAEAMGLRLLIAYPPGDMRHCGDGWNGLMFSASPHPCLFIDSGAYDPLHDDAQCFALVKKFRIYLDPDFNDQWQAVSEDTEALNADLNRAVVESVARMTLTPSSRPPDARRR